MAAPIETDPDLDKELVIRARQAAVRWETRGEVRKARTLSPRSSATRRG